MQQNQNGFGAIEGLLILVVVCVLGFIGWYVYNTKHNSDTFLNFSKSAAQSSKLLNGWRTYQGNGFSLQYPGNWRFVAKNATYASDEFLPSVDYPNNNGNSLQFSDAQSNLSLAAYAATQGPANVLSTKNTTTNRYTSLTENYDVPGVGGVPDGYQLFVGHDGTIVQFNYNSGETYTQTYLAIINTIKFTD